MGEAANDRAPGIAVIREHPAGAWLVFDNPVEVVQAHALDAVLPCLDRVVWKPMKGTLSRGRFQAEDAERAARLRESEKNRAGRC